MRKAFFFGIYEDTSLQIAHPATQRPKRRLDSMTHSNFIDNVSSHDASPLQEVTILNRELMADMSTSPHFAGQYISACEISIGAGHTVRLVDDRNLLYRGNVECKYHTSPQSVISEILLKRGDGRTMRIGITVSKNYGLHMSPERSFQFYKRELHDLKESAEQGE